MGAGDGRTAMGGFVTAEVARVELELADGRVVSDATEPAPRALETDARLFVVRVPGDAFEGRGATSAFPVRAYVSFGADGRLLERHVVGPS